MSQGARVLRPDRGQLHWDMVDLDTQLPPEHRARIVWAFVAGLDLGSFYDRIKARDEIASRPASDPAVLLAVWLYAIVEGIGAARGDCAFVRTSRRISLAVRGSEFRRTSGDVLDRLLTPRLAQPMAASPCSSHRRPKPLRSSSPTKLDYNLASGSPMVARLAIAPVTAPHGFPLASGNPPAVWTPAFAG
jgi:hypothetical protein